MSRSVSIVQKHPGGDALWVEPACDQCCSGLGDGAEGGWFVEGGVKGVGESGRRTGMGWAPVVMTVLWGAVVEGRGGAGGCLNLIRKTRGWSEEEAVFGGAGG
jgi:hypothetical protein